MKLQERIQLEPSGNFASLDDLRRTVIADAAARVERYRLPDAVDHRRPLWSVVTAIGLLLQGLE